MTAVQQRIRLQRGKDLIVSLRLRGTTEIFRSVVRPRMLGYCVKTQSSEFHFKSCKSYIYLKITKTLQQILELRFFSILFGWMDMLNVNLMSATDFTDVGAEESYLLCHLF